MIGPRPPASLRQGIVVVPSRRARLLGGALAGPGRPLLARTRARQRPHKEASVRQAIVVKRLGIVWFRLTAFGLGALDGPPGYREARLSRSALRVDHAFCGRGC